MTPDRIYIFYDGDERWYDVKEWEGRTPPPANVEYIRKDSLWKPTEEQMSALLAVLNDPDNIGSQSCQLALSELYDDLMKLKAL